MNIMKTTAERVYEVRHMYLNGRISADSAVCMLQQILMEVGYPCPDVAPVMLGIENGSYPSPDRWFEEYDKRMNPSKQSESHHTSFGEALAVLGVLCAIVIYAFIIIPNSSTESVSSNDCTESYESSINNGSTRRSFLDDIDITKLTVDDESEDCTTENSYYMEEE